MPKLINTITDFDYDEVKSLVEDVLKLEHWSDSSSVVIMPCKESKNRICIECRPDSVIASEKFDAAALIPYQRNKKILNRAIFSASRREASCWADASLICSDDTDQFLEFLGLIVARFWGDSTDEDDKLSAQTILTKVDNVLLVTKSKMTGITYHEVLDAFRQYEKDE